MWTKGFFFIMNPGLRQSNLSTLCILDACRRGSQFFLFFLIAGFNQRGIKHIEFPLFTPNLQDNYALS